MKKQTGAMDKGFSFVDERDRKIYENYAVRLREYMKEHEIQNSKDVPLDVQNKLYLDVVGWRKGTVSAYYEKPRSDSSMNTNATPTAELEQIKRLLIETRSEITVLKEQSSQ
ncbi:hypothetical protein AKJ16_DCAP16060 [Drosera capensis]